MYFLNMCGLLYQLSLNKTVKDEKMILDKNNDIKLFILGYKKGSFKSICTIWA